MHIRSAIATDEPLMATICARTFFSDDLFGRVIHLHRSTYPEDVQNSRHECHRQNWSSPRSRIIVAVCENGEQQKERLVGVAIWARQGDDVGAKRAMEDHVNPGTWQDLIPMQIRAQDLSKATIIRDSGPYIKHYWAGARPNNRYLTLCCVDPAYQQHGCGRLLVRWGLKRAQEEGISASVIASDGSTGFSLKCGFNNIVGNASRAGVQANPMMKANVKVGEILFIGVEDEVETGGV